MSFSILPYMLGANITTPPVIQSYSPAPGAQSPLQSQVVVTFSEVMESGSVLNLNNWVLTTSVGDNLSRILAVSILNAGTGNPTQALLTFSLSGIVSGQSYTLTALNRIVNLAGFALGGSLAATFSNGAILPPPTILSWNPTTTNLGIIPAPFIVTAYFSQAMNAATVTNLANWQALSNFGSVTILGVTYDAVTESAQITLSTAGVYPGYGFAITAGSGIQDTNGQGLAGQTGNPYTYLGPALAPPPWQIVLQAGNSAGIYNVDLNLNQALNWRFENLAVLPAFGHPGRVVFNTTDGRFYGDKGTSWGPIGGAIGSPNTVPLYDGSGNLTSSTTTATQLSYLDATSSIQTQLNGKQASGNYITGTTGDVTATGPGSVAATVNSVGGSSAANVHTAELLVNTARAGNVFLASPANGTSAAPAFRAIVVADIPILNQNTTGTAANVTGTVAIGNGGTGQTTQAAAFDALSPNTTTGDVTYYGAATNSRLAGNTTTTRKFLRSTGTGSAAQAPAWDTLIAADIPILNQNTTGTAANVTGTVAIGNGGTGQTTAAAAFGALSPLTTKGDLLAYGSANARVPVGTDGQTLVADSTQALGVKWTNVQKGSKNYIPNADFEANVTTGWRLANTALDSNKNPTTVSNPGAALATAQYIFTITSGNATVGATYTNNTQTFTVVNTIAAKTILVCTGTGAPAASGTLTKATGTGDATITFSAFKLTTAAATLSFTTTATNPLAGTYSGSLVSSAATTAGDMLISDPFTIDQEDQAQMLAFLARYKLLSGTGVWAGNNTNTYAAWIYDVTNGAWIQPAGVYNFIQSSGVGKASGTYQTPSNGSQFQFAIVNINATSGAITTLVDDISVGPQQMSSGAAMSDWQSYTLTIGADTTAPTPGTNTTAAYWKREGDQMRIRFEFNQSAAGSSGSGDYRFPLPAGYTIDTTKVSTSLAGNAQSLGSVSCFDGTNSLPGTVFAAGSTYLKLFIDNTGNIGSSHVPLGNASARIGFEAIVPITGWSSNTVQSADFDGRLCEAKYQVSGAQAPGASLPINFAASVWDTHAAVTTGSGWKFVAPSTGYYWVAVTLAVASGTGPVSVYKNGVQDTYLFQATTTVASGSTKIKLNAGDYIDLRFDSALTTGSLVTANWVSISRDSGPAVVQASESVNARYHDTSGLAISATATVVNFGSKDYDSHGWYSGGTYTVGVSGKFSVKSVLVTAATALAATNTFIIQIFKSGTSVYYNQIPGNGNSLAYVVTAADTLQCVAGDTIQIKMSFTTGTSTLSTSVPSVLAIERVGN